MTGRTNNVTWQFSIMCSFGRVMVFLISLIPSIFFNCFSRKGKRITEKRKRKGSKNQYPLVQRLPVVFVCTLRAPRVIKAKINNSRMSLEEHPLSTPFPISISLAFRLEQSSFTKSESINQWNDMRLPVCEMMKIPFESLRMDPQFVDVLLYLLLPIHALCIPTITNPFGMVETRFFLGKAEL